MATVAASSEIPISLHPPLAPLVQELKKWLRDNGKYHLLQQAVKSALSEEIPQMTQWGIVDAEKFLEYASGMLKWIPTENVQGKEIYWILTLFYFIFDQASMITLQNPINPDQVGKKLTYVSEWMVRYAKEMGSFLNEPESLTPESYETFEASGSYNLDQALLPDPTAPMGGFKNFNDLFSRHLKPGMRHISDPDNDTVVVYPADSTFDGHWKISPNNHVTIKGLDWPIKALLAGSDYADRFEGGVWMHSFLNTFDYHRQHAPVAGRVIEAKIIEGFTYLNVIAQKDDQGRTHLKPHRSYMMNEARRSQLGYSINDSKLGSLDAPDDAGYQFLQMRGLFTIDNPTLGLVAVLPIGMAQVSSVIPSVKKGDVLSKGDEISCFKFGGSDIVVVFEKKAKVHFDTEGHHLVGDVLCIANI